MCEFFVKADPIKYEPRSRTLRIHGVLTSLRLENMVWDVLAEMAEREGRTTNALISLFHDEILAHRGEVPNFASFLRVTCMRYLRRAALEAEGSGADPDEAPAAPRLAVVAAASAVAHPR
jgi:predicted DNA-binding ribbon-helix-helix protein